MAELQPTRAALEHQLTETARQLAELELMLQDYQAERRRLLRQARQLQNQLEALELSLPNASVSVTK